jgi:hypothetical protein
MTTATTHPKGKRPLPDLSDGPRHFEQVLLGIYVGKEFRDRVHKAVKDTKCKNMKRYVLRALENQLKADYGE